jgi:hypothetical protein
MKAHSQAKRKTLEKDRIAICPIFGCETLTRVKPLKFGFLGFNKYPKCKKHATPLVYIDVRINDFIDAALSCLFDKAGLPPEELLTQVKTNFPKEIESFIYNWVYSITIGRGAPIISRYMDSISNAYLKKLTKKQKRSLQGENTLKTQILHQAIKDGMQEITKQYTRLLEHLRVYSEIISDFKHLKQLSHNLRKTLLTWQSQKIPTIEEASSASLIETKNYYDHILNMGTCRCILGLSPEEQKAKKKRISAFDRYSAYYDFFKEGITKKFTKSDIKEILTSNSTETLINPITNNHKDFGALYLFTDIRTNKVYIGQTIRDIFTRFAEHLCVPCNQYLRKAIKYYKEKNFNLRIIKVSENLARTENDEFRIELIGYASTQDELNKMEVEEIKTRKSCVLDYFAIKDKEIIPLYGYNISRGGTHRTLILSGKNAASFDFIQESELLETDFEKLINNKLISDIQVDLLTTENINELNPEDYFRNTFYFNEKQFIPKRIVKHLKKQKEYIKNFKYPPKSKPIFNGSGLNLLFCKELYDFIIINRYSSKINKYDINQFLLSNEFEEINKWIYTHHPDFSKLNEDYFEIINIWINRTALNYKELYEYCKYNDIMFFKTISVLNGKIRYIFPWIWSLIMNILIIQNSELKRFKLLPSYIKYGLNSETKFINYIFESLKDILIEETPISKELITNLVKDNN